MSCSFVSLTLIVVVEEAFESRLTFAAFLDRYFLFTAILSRLEMQK